MRVLRGYRHIAVDPSVRGGRPVIKGTRVAVEDVLEALSSGWSIEEVADQFNVAEEAVLEALKYASEALKNVSAVAVD
jgi:uncharacterized protein (DUF433 family)